MSVKDAVNDAMTPDEAHKTLDDAMAQLESATTVDQLKPVLKALINVQRSLLNPPGYLGI